MFKVFSFGDGGRCPDGRGLCFSKLKNMDGAAQVILDRKKADTSAAALLLMNTIRKQAEEKF